MATVHVVGPVVRDSRFRPPQHWVQDAYETITKQAGELNAAANIPVSDRFLERAEPVTFVNRTIAAIEASNVVVTVFTPGDVSAAVEATAASYLGKKQLILTNGNNGAPRMLRGLPGVAGIVSAEDRADLAKHLRSFLRDNLGRTRTASS